MSVALQKPGKPSKSREATGAAVAARLEANPAIQRAKIDTAQVYYHLDFLSADECAG